MTSGLKSNCFLQIVVLFFITTCEYLESKFELECAMRWVGFMAALRWKLPSGGRAEHPAGGGWGDGAGPSAGGKHRAQEPIRGTPLGTPLERPWNVPGTFKNCRSVGMPAKTGPGPLRGSFGMAISAEKTEGLRTSNLGSYLGPSTPAPWPQQVLKS